MLVAVSAFYSLYTALVAVRAVSIHGSGCGGGQLLLCFGLQYSKRLFGVTFVTDLTIASAVIFSSNSLYKMNGDSCACGGQIVKVTPNNRLL